MYLHGTFPLSCNIQLSGPDFPFSINQDPGYPETWGSQAASAGRAFVSLPERVEVILELNSVKPTFLSEKVQQFGRVRH